MTSNPTSANWISIASLGFIWGGTFMVVSIALQGYGPLTVACARTTLGAIALFTLMKVMGRNFPVWTPKLAGLIFVTGALNSAIPFSLLSWGQLYVPSAFAGISMAALPLFVLPMAHVFADDRLNLHTGIGVVIGFIGALILIGPGVLKIGTGLEPLGQLACIGASISYAISAILTRRCPPMDAVAMATALLIVGTILLIPAMLLVEGIPTLTQGRATVAIIFLGIVPTALAALLRVSVIRSAGPVFMTLVNYQVPVWAMIFGWLILSEDLPLRFFTALALILTGLAISQSRSLKRLFSRA